MNKIIRRYVVPLSIILGGSFLISFLANYVDESLYFFLIVAMLFAFGFSLNNQKSRLKNFSWRHIIIVLVLIFLSLYDLNILNIKVFDLFRKYVVADNIVIKVIYVYLGWLFVEKWLKTIQKLI